MFSNVFFKQMYDERRRLLMWGLSTGLVGSLMMFLWPSMRDMPDLDEFLANYPQAMRDLFNIEAITSVAGFLNAELFSFLLPGLFLIFGITRGAALVAGEEEAGKLELVLVTSIPRVRFALHKVAALTMSIVSLAVTIFLFLWVSGLVVDAGLPTGELAAGMTSVMFLGLEHGLLAMAVGLLTGSKTWATGVASAVAVGGYVLYAAGKFVAAVEPFQVASPIYHALESGPVGGGFRPVFLLMPLVGIVALVLALPRFDRRDIGV